MPCNLLPFVFRQPRNIRSMSFCKFFKIYAYMYIYIYILSFLDITVEMRNCDENERRVTFRETCMIILFRVDKVDILF